MSRMERILRRRSDERRRMAAACASHLLDDARKKGIEISIVGSLAKGSFRSHSDVDFLVWGDTSPERRATIERIAADQFRKSGIPYDLIYASDITSDRVEELVHDCV